MERGEIVERGGERGGELDRLRPAPAAAASGRRERGEVMERRGERGGELNGFRLAATAVAPPAFAFRS